jgi:hypothetical protein
MEMTWLCQHTTCITTNSSSSSGWWCGSEYKSRRGPKIAQHQHSCYFIGIDVHFFFIFRFLFFVFFL